MTYDVDRLAVVSLSDAEARERDLCGTKAANLAHAAAEGLPVLPGFVIVPATRAPRAPRGPEALRAAWRELGGERQPLVVRSSSVIEDTEQSSMAGRFESVLDVRAWNAFGEAVRRVLDSAGRSAPPPTRDRPTAHPAALDMAVLVQPMLEARAGGVMFGADPVEGRFDRILVSAVRGGPDQLVSGRTEGVRYQLTRYGHLLHTEPAVPRRSRPLGRRALAQLVRLAGRTERVYGSPQDVEFAFDSGGKLWLFQSRPITAMAGRPPRGARLLGPGPVAETLPHVLQPLEEDLWLAPMNQGLTLALDITGAAPRRTLRRLPVATSVDGRAVADLLLIGAAPAAHPVLKFINPAPGARRAAAAWRVGRLRVALPLLARDLMADVDRQLHDLVVPRLLLSGELLGAIAWGRTVLASLHAQESLAGALLDNDTGNTAAGEALAVLAEGRAGGLSEEELLTRHPVLLTLLPPTLGERPPLPPHADRHDVPRGVASLSLREGLRLRIRWVQEMQSAMVAEIGNRMDQHHLAGERHKIALLRWPELLGLGDHGTRPVDLANRVPRPDTPQLPAAFRLADGRPQAVPAGRRHGRGGDGHEGQAAGGGYGTGTVWHGEGAVPQDAVLVVATLDPALAPLLPDLSGLVAETGSVLSHLAVLAREHQVPTVVGVEHATDRFRPGTTVRVDGATGTVEAIPAAGRADDGIDGGESGTNGRGPRRPGGRNPM
ncbi:PEP/pyruvate-binding domain-containing protein [Streptomyces sp. NPDC048560]|uniref:PEP/pyruvate-binding domain-containing protein n=1 Tax=Streptomyces sp. NPDC048560 TaxID=3155488 RepID=UPI003429BD97